MKELERIQKELRSLQLSETASALPEYLQRAEHNDWTHLEFLIELVDHEQNRRGTKLIERRMKWAAFPTPNTLQDFRVEEQEALTEKQIRQLKEFTWIDQLYNLILLGAPGTGKTLLATGLGVEAIHQGYKVAFISMGELVHVMKTEEITRKSQLRMKRIREANLVIIDDLMFMAMDYREANLFFHLINDLYDRASVILTSNKAPHEWGELLGDHGITTAILDRLVHRAEVVHFEMNDSYRMKHRTTIFKEESVQN
ncbi:IS21-like element helper ATPase IstB [Alkalicoccus chagannorensis]|uniref:IS21-like element helper ATPase IstB n=1 Tax=Alkalicoccus chagannorensis TaxID=427072 RepID=UPI0003F91000|nr:IS21-like element helper ATPase IstB [Alkalicoccus chagannorensis]